MYVCLVRHGKAEPYGIGKADKNRELIEKGKDQVRTMAKAAMHWWPDGVVSLWSSPYVRACQTAGILEQQLSPVAFHTHEAIAAGDLQGVYNDIICKDTSDVICIVGHAPSLNEWAKKWTGTEIDFKTGSMALFDVDPYGGKLGSAKLFLYVQPKGAALFR